MRRSRARFSQLPDRRQAGIVALATVQLGLLLNELPGGRTRLLVSGYAASHPRGLTAIGDLLFWEPAHWIMQLRQLTNLKERAERAYRIAGDVPEPAGDISSAGVG